MFDYPLNPEVLQWLAAGRLDDRLQRSLRLWVLLRQLYGQASPWSRELSQPFRYGDIRRRLFASSHGQQENMTVQELTQGCASHSERLRQRTCICQWTLADWLQDTYLSLADWQQAIARLTGMDAAAVQHELEQAPFATVHRSIRKDLALLAAQGWLETPAKGQYRCRKPQQWPSLPQQGSLQGLSAHQSWELLRALEDIAFVQPNLYIAIQSLWEQLAGGGEATEPSGPPSKRIFIHLDYILSEEIQERVDTLQEQIEQLWKTDTGVIRFEYEFSPVQTVLITVYPVCLHYSRRAKYLSAYGFDPEGQFGWHNYRLDRIVSDRLQIVTWDKLSNTDPLSQLHAQRALPTPATVDAALKEAWGFNFYFPKCLLIMRFSPAYAQRYVDDTQRHPTFRSASYPSLIKLVEQCIPETAGKAQVLVALQNRPATDAYYTGWIRLNDINIVMRLRDWRPQGEVIAPLAMRERMHQEALQELAHYC